MRLVLFLLVLALVTGCVSNTDDTERVTVTTIRSEGGEGQVSVTTTTGKTVSTTTGVTASTTTLAKTLDADKFLYVACENMTGKDKDSCFHNRALNLKDLMVCDSIVGVDLQARCIAEVKRDPKLCGEIDDPVHAGWCYNTLALKTNELGLCKKINDRGVRDKCMLTYLKYKKPDPYECFNIRDIDLRDDCIMHHVGIDLIHPRLCVVIEDPELELECNMTYATPDKMMCSAG